MSFTTLDSAEARCAGPTLPSAASDDPEKMFL
jgi:hypothetical protein